MNLEAIRPSIEDHATGLKVLESVDIVDGLLEQVRNLALDLHPAVLDDFGLAAALRCYVRRLAQRGGLELEFAIDDFAERLPPTIEPPVSALLRRRSPTSCDTPGRDRSSLSCAAAA
jgi:signal transduction histidine kinase